ncbi:hypothetical protein [Sphingomonas sp.]|uniref:hypothetical protein n=1 Tax=Sphingomonas sp. TaxID=28214 RepID=UPI001EC73170|nr:hypothetical protein [Sphingomonas sp.]MBX3593908.1 hypothetical protein [Sphingomonas sp.]
MYYLVAITLFVGGIALCTWWAKGAENIKRDAFNRRNAAGVLIYDSYEQSEAANRAEGSNQMKGALGLLAIGASFVLALMQYVSDEKQGLIDADREDRAYRMCTKAWDQRDGSLQSCRDWCVFKQNKNNCQKIFGSTDGPVGETR